MANVLGLHVLCDEGRDGYGPTLPVTIMCMRSALRCTSNCRSERRMDSKQLPFYLSIILHSFSVICCMSIKVYGLTEVQLIFCHRQC